MKVGSAYTHSSTPGLLRYLTRSTNAGRSSSARAAVTRAAMEPAAAAVDAMLTVKGRKGMGAAEAQRLTSLNALHSMSAILLSGGDGECCDDAQIGKNKQTDGVIF